MRYRVVNANTEEVFETDSLKIAYIIADQWIRLWERNNDLPWYTHDVSIYDFVKKDFVDFKTKYI